MVSLFAEEKGDELKARIADSECVCAFGINGEYVFSIEVSVRSFTEFIHPPPKDYSEIV